ncbi:MAG TPA: hypothetical protein VIJ14_00400 [Rhabdochlamydiaceae bacterium]
MANRDGVNNQGNQFMSQDSVSSEAIVTSAAHEHVVPQSKVNEIVQTAKDDAYRKGLAAAQQQSSQAPSVDLEQHRRMVRAEIEQEREAQIKSAQLKAQQEYAESLGKKFDANINAAKAKFDDFGTKASRIPWDKYLGVVHLVNKLGQEDAARLLNEVGSSRKKLNELEFFAQSDFEGAEEEVASILKSIERNEAASTVELPREPLSQMKQSSSGIKKSSEELSDADLLRKWRR